MDNTDNLLVIGVITSAYGVKGWVKVKSFTQPEANFLDYTDCFIQSGKQWRAAKIEQGREHGKGIAVKFVGVDDRNASEALAKCEVAVPAQSLPELDEEDFYWHQLEGLEVWVGDKLLGRVSHLLETGANDVLVVRACQGSMDKRERLLPYRPEVILRVDLEAGRIEAEWDPEF